MNKESLPFPMPLDEVREHKKNHHYRYRQEKDRLLLASASPRRREILAAMGLRFSVKVPTVDETLPCALSPENAVLFLARKKALAAAELASLGECVIASDTSVAIDGEILGKPKDVPDAEGMLTHLSGRMHTVHTGVAVLKKTEGGAVTLLSGHTESRVFFRTLTKEEIFAYIATGEPMDKAGAYGVQGLGAALVERVEGEMDNVMGLPSLLVDRLLLSLREQTSPRARLFAIASLLEKRYPEAECALKYEGDPFRLLVMGRLSAQCTDERVNLVAGPLFARFPTAAAMAEAELSEVEELIRSCGLYHTKAKEIIAASRRLTEVYGGTLPDTMEELLTLPGVGRKIANLLLGDIFGRSAVVADTHCIRLAARWGFCPEGKKDPLLTERTLTPLFGEGMNASDFCHRVVLFGREVCMARNPRCHDCPLAREGLCARPAKTEQDGE